MSNYNYQQFRKIVSDKKGNIIFFKEKLREYRLISEYAKLADIHIDLFNRGKEVKEKITVNMGRCFQSSVKRLYWKSNC